MNGQLFEIGQAVTPVSDPEKWLGKEAHIMPVFGEVYHVKKYNFEFGMWWVILEELLDCDNFDQEAFAPVLSDGVLSEALQEIFEEDLVIGK